MKSQIRCYGCGFQRPESEEICLRCLTNCKIELADLPILLRKAGDFLQPTRGGIGSGSSSGQIPSGHNDPAMNFVQGADLLGTLYAWQDLTRDLLGLEERLNLRGTVEAKVNNAVEFLQVHWEWFSKQADFINDFMNEIHGLHKRGMAITGQTQIKPTQIECPADIDGIKCGRKLTIDTSDMKALVQCPRCRSEWNTERFLLVVGKSEIWLDVEAIAYHKNLSVSQIGKLIKKFGMQRRSSKDGRYDMNKFLTEYEKRIVRVDSK